MRFLRISLFTIMLIHLFQSSAGAVIAQFPDSQYFMQTGHTVSGLFLEYYRDLKEPLRQIGYPITRQYYSPLTQTEVQYFQKARLELVDGEVRLAPLGLLMHDAGAPLAPVKQMGTACQTFRNSAFSTCNLFREYYQAFDGKETLGLPISEVEIRERRYVQYFTYGRLEWRPENPPDEMVVVSDLGRIYFDDVINDSSLKQADQPAFILASQVQPTALAFVARPLAPAGEKQTIYVAVHDQARHPLAGVGVSVILHYPDREPQILPAQTTRQNGLVQVSFTIAEVDVRTIVPVDVVVTLNGQEAKAKTWFRVWW